MKTKGYVALLGCILFNSIIFSQEVENCGTGNKVIVNSELIVSKNYSSCIKDVAIDSSDPNIRMYGTIRFHKDKSLRITPTGNQIIRIKAYDLITDESPIIIKTGDRTRLGSRTGESKENIDQTSISSTIKIYPNPTTVALTIESEQPIIHYKIVDTFGINTWEGTPTNNNIDVSTLPLGMYELILQTNTTTITKTFIKN